MDKYEHKPNKGSIFKHQKRDDQDTRDYHGGGALECTHCGQLNRFEISGYINTSKGSGMKYQGLSFWFKDENKGGDTPPSERPTFNLDDDVDDDIPF